MPPFRPKNMFAGINTGLSEELLTILVERNIPSPMKIQRIISPRGYCSADGLWYDQNQDEFVLVLRGKAGLRFKERENKIMELQAGDFVVIQTHEKHRVEWTSTDEETVWLCMFY